MAKAKYETAAPVQHPGVGALFGHLIVSNDQVHDFQEKIVKAFFERKQIPYDCFRDVIFYREGAMNEADALRLLTAEPPEIRAEIYYYLVLVSEIDGFSDPAEKAFFQRFLQRIPIPNANELRTAAEKRAKTERERMKRNNAVGYTGKRANRASRDNVFRITQKEYKRSFEVCRKTAEADFEAVRPIANAILEECAGFYKKLTGTDFSTADFHPEVKAALKAFSEGIGEEILREAQDYKTQLDRKEATKSDFSVALIGRTKAGKSTLRAVLTGEGKDGIGHGAQRTTRVNNIYEWNHLRIIDTPGIDAAADEDENDRKIAEKVIGESDVICYIAASDGLPLNARTFAVEIARRNKPVIMLVNYKKNIRDEKRLARFLKRPYEWSDMSRDNNISGYFNPIRRLAEENGVDKLIRYHAVFLDAALLSREPQYADHAKLLSDASGIDRFLADLKDVVVSQGPFLRSKTVIDDTVILCNGWTDRLRGSLQPIHEMLDVLQKEYPKTERRLRSAQTKMLNALQKEIGRAFDKLAKEDAATFAELHFSEHGDLSDKWTTYCEEIGFTDLLRERVETEYGAFIAEVNTLTRELAEDLEIEAFNLNPKKSINGTFDFPLRNVMRFGGAAIGIAGTVLTILGVATPVGVALIVGSLVIGLLANLFKSKKKRQQDAQNRLYRKLCDAINAQKEQQIKQITDEAKKTTDKIIKQVSEIYSSYIDGVNAALNYTEDFISDITDEADSLNVVFAQRIMEFLTGRHFDIDKVKRTVGKEFKIYPRQYAAPESLPMEKLSGLMNEKVKIVNDGR